MHKNLYAYIYIYMCIYIYHYYHIYIDICNDKWCAGAGGDSARRGQRAGRIPPLLLYRLPQRRRQQWGPVLLFNLTSASVFEEILCFRSICTPWCFAMCNMIQVCSDFHWARVFITRTRPDEISSQSESKGDRVLLFALWAAPRMHVWENLAHKKLRPP